MLLSFLNASVLLLLVVWSASLGKRQRRLGNQPSGHVAETAPKLPTYRSSQSLPRKTTFAASRAAAAR
jgi:hypothetical protein